MNLLKGEGTDEERDMMSPAHYVTEDFPPSYVLTASHDFLKEDGKMMFELLQAKNVECDYKLYGSAEKPLYHVFHCDIKSEDAKQANDDEINFFKKYID